MNLFIDANVFLSFYHFTSDDLNELEKLIHLIEQDELRLYLPQQVREEVRRNRAVKIDEGLKAFERFTFKIPFPSYCKNYTTYDEMANQIKQIDKLHKKLIDDIRDDIENKKLKSDQLIENLFKLSIDIERTDQIVKLAQIRHDVGNPPGKRGSLGDAINWESLLHSVPEIAPLCFITYDGDFKSALDKEKMDTFLLDEWSSKKNGSCILFYSNLSAFFKDKFPSININENSNKDYLISQLSSSPNFSDTHVIIARLNEYADFTQKQTEQLINALLNNTQVAWILDDIDVYSFYKKILISDKVYWDRFEEFNKAMDWADEQIKKRVA